MAELDPSFFPHTVGGVVGWVSTAALAVFTAWTQFRKGRVDESATILKAWKEMVDAHQAQIAGIREEFTSYKTSAIAEFAAYKKNALEEIGDLRKRLLKAEGRITELETENTGLKRAIAQQSQSNAVMLGPSAGNRAPTSRDRFGMDEQAVPQGKPDADLIAKLS